VGDQINVGSVKWYTDRGKQLHRDQAGWRPGKGQQERHIIAIGIDESSQRGLIGEIIQRFERRGFVSLTNDSTYLATY